MALQIKTEIFINKKPAEVWKTFMDFPSYPQWNPFITRIVQLSDSRLDVDLGSGKSKMTIQPEILKNVPEQEFRWLGKLGGVNWLFAGEHYFLFKEKDGGTLLQHGENFHGILITLLWPLMKGTIQANFIKVNEALKALVEKP